MALEDKSRHTEGRMVCACLNVMGGLHLKSPEKRQYPGRSYTWAWEWGYHRR